MLKIATGATISTEACRPNTGCTVFGLHLVSSTPRLMHRPRKPRVSDATQEIHAKIVAKPSGSRASLPKKPAATNTTKMSSTLDHMPVPHLKPLRSHSLRPSPVRPTTI